MKNLNWKNVFRLSRLQLVRQRAHVGKALLCAGLIIALSMIVHVGDFKGCCENAVKWTLVLSLFFPTIWTFINVMDDAKNIDQSTIPVNPQELYLGAWLSAIINALVWLAVVGVISIGVLWALGNFYYAIPMNSFLRETFSGFSLFSVVSMGLLVTMVVVSTIAWRLSRTLKYALPIIVLCCALLLILLLPIAHLSIGYALLSIFYWFWGYYLFKCTFDRDKK